MSPFSKSTTNPRKPLLLKGGTIVSMDAAVGNLEQGDILIEGSKIAAIAPSVSADGAEVLDMRGMLISPGFVDCHRHAWEAQLRHLNPNSSNLLDYCCATHFSFARFYRPIDMYVGTILTAIGGIDAGITTFVDNSHNARTDDHAIAAVCAWQDAGSRVVFAPGPPSMGAWEETGWPRQRLSRLQDRVQETELITLAVMAQFIPEVWSCARELNIPIVTEVASPALGPLIQDFDAKGLLGPDNIFNHITALAPEVLDTLRRRGVRVNVCPRSDAQYGQGDGGMGSFQAALDAGLKPAFSIDNETSYSGDMFGEMRAEIFLQRAMTQRDRFAGKENVPPALTVTQALEAATIDGARCAGLDQLTGSLVPGKEADLIAIRTSDLNLYPLNNALGAIVHGADRSNVDTVIIGGRIRKSRGVIVGLDHGELRRIIDESRTYLTGALGYQPNLFCDYHHALWNDKPDVNRWWL